MKKFSLRTNFWLVAVVAVCFWWFDSGYRTILKEPLSNDYLLTVSARAVPGTNHFQIRVTYHYPPGLIYVVNEFRSPKPIGGWQFGVVRDQGMVCVFDKNDLNWIWIYSEVDDDVWESSPGRNGSLYATNRLTWQNRLSALRKKHPEVPYAELPE